MNPPKLISPFRLASLLRLQNDPKLALQLFQNPNPNADPKASREPFRYSLLSYDRIICKLGRAKMFDEMQKILFQLKAETRFVPKEVLFCRIITFYGRARRPNDALKVFDEMPSFRCERTIKSFNSLMNSLLMCKEYDKMGELISNVERHGNPDACTCNILIHGLGRSGRMDDALNLFGEMREKGISPSSVTFGTLIYGLCLNMRLKEAFKLKDDMLKVYGMRPNGNVYAPLIKGACGVGELALAFKLKEEMVRYKIELDAPIYSTLISGLLKVGRKEEAFGMLEEMNFSGCKPDTVTYNVLINWFCKENDFETAYKLLDEMVEKGCKPDVTSYNVILQELCKQGKWSEASELFEDMPRRGCTPDVVSRRILFDGLCDGMRFKEAAFVLDEMVFNGYVPHPDSICKFVDKLLEERNDELMWSVFNSLGKIKPIDIDLRRMAIAMVLKDDKLSSAYELLHSLVIS